MYNVIFDVIFYKENTVDLLWFSVVSQDYSEKSKSHFFFFGMTSIISKSENSIFGFDMKHASDKQQILKKCP